MTNKEKINLIEDALELDENTLKEETLLADVGEYDSMAKLTLIVLCDDEFNKKLTGEQIKEFKTVKNILDFMG
jgi:acyl carrier protein